MLKLGILGVGHLASYTVRGLRYGGDQRPIMLSPRGQATAELLAEECGCSIASSNQEVIDSADIVLLSVRPDALSELLQDLIFKPGQIVISVMAGISLRQLKNEIPQKDLILARALPSTSAEVNAGPIPVYPDNRQVKDLFDPLGQVVPLKSEELFDTALAHACLHGWSYYLIQSLIDWSKQQGMDETTARQMVAHSISSAVQFAEANPDQSYQEIGESIASEGTFTRKGIDHIQNSGGLESWVKAMDIVTG